MGGGQTINNEAPRVGALRIQTSAFGIPLAIVWGQTRVQGNVLWFGDFTAIPHTTTQQSGGKGGGSVTYNNTTYTYTAAVAIGLCEGPIDSIPAVWAGKERTTMAALGFSTFTGVPAQTPWGYLTSLHPGQDLGYEGIAYAANGNYALQQDGSLPNHSFEVRGPLSTGLQGALAKTFTVSPAPGAAKNATSWVNSIFSSNSTKFTVTAHGFADNQPVIFSSVAPAGFSVNSTYYVLLVDANTLRLRYAVGGAPISGPSGSAGGTWPLQPGVSVFSSTAHGFAEGNIVRLTTTGTLPQGLALGTDNYVRLLTANTYSLAASGGGTPILVFSSGSGTHTATPFIVDANPKDVLNDFLTNLDYGVLFPTTKIGDWSQYSNYCVARGLFVSPALTAQAPANQFVTDLLDLTNSGPVWSGNLLKIVPYGDTVVSGNGVTFTPSVTPIYDLTDDDFIAPAGSDPVRQIRSATADAFNQRQVKFTNRANQYNDEIAEAKDQANIELYGLRPDQQTTLPYINDAGVARAVVQTKLQRGLYIRNTYEFTIGMKYSLLEPMDIVTLTDPGLFLAKAPVRITEVEDSDDGILIRAEEFPAGVGHAALYSSQLAGGYSTDYNVAPGNVNAPLIFDAPGILTTSGYEIWIAAAGGPNWGGCKVWASEDNVQFRQIGQISGGARYGSLTANFASGADPDTIDTLSVDLSSARGSLVGGTNADADAFNTLCWVDSELVSYRDATLTSAYNYNLGGYLRRGVYNTPIGAHVSGAAFVRLDQAIFQDAYDPSLVGKTVYFKFSSYNIYGGAAQDISTLASYPFTIGGSISIPSNVTGFTATKQASGILLAWTPVADRNIFGYEIRIGSSWASSTLVDTAKAGATITVPPIAVGTSTYLIKAIDRSGKYSATAASVNVTINALGTPVVTNTIVDGDTVLSWPQVTSDFLLDHYEIRTGASWAGGTFVANTYATSSKQPVIWLGNQTYQVAAVDIAGNVGPAGALTINVTVPTAPTVSGTFAAENFILTWTAASATLPVLEYEIRYGADFPTGTSLGRVKGTTFRGKAIWGASRSFFIEAIDARGNFGASGNTSLTVTSPSSPSIQQQVIDNNVLLTWTDSAQALPIDYYTITKGPTFIGSSLIGNISGRFTAIFETNSGTYTYWIVGVDTAGNIGTQQSISVLVNQPPDYQFFSNQNSELDSPDITNILRIGGPYYALSFANDSTKYGSVASIPALDSGVTALTVEAWFQYQGGQSGGIYAKTVGGTVNTSFSLFCSGTTILMRVTSTTPANFDATYDLAAAGYKAGDWIHAVGRWDGTNVKIAVQGTNQASTAAAITLKQGAGAVYVGKLDSGTTFPYTGQIAVVNVLTRAISDTEVSERYHGIYKTQTNLVASWNFSEGTGFTVQDDSDNANDLLLNGSPPWVLTALDGRYDNFGLSKQILYPASPTKTYTEKFAINSWLTPQDQITGGSPLYCEPCETSGSYVEIIDYGTTLAATKINAQLTSNVIAGTVTVTPTISVSNTGPTGPWTDFAGVWSTFASTFRWVKITLTISATAGPNMQSANVLNFRLDVKLRNDAGVVNCVSTDSGGTSFNFNIAFVSITSINGTYNDTANAYFPVVNFTSVPNPTSAKMLLFDRATGNRVSGPVYWSAKGN